MKKTIILSLIICFLLYPRKEEAKVPLNSVKPHIYNKDTLTIEQPCLIFIRPNNNGLKKLKIKHGEDDFYIIADDANYYVSMVSIWLNRLGRLKYIDTIHTEKNICFFKKQNIIITKNDIKEAPWFLIDYTDSKAPSMYSVVDYSISMPFHFTAFLDYDNFKDTIYFSNNTMDGESVFHCKVFFGNKKTKTFFIPRNSIYTELSRSYKKGYIDKLELLSDKFSEKALEPKITERYYYDKELNNWFIHSIIKKDIYTGKVTIQEKFDKIWSIDHTVIKHQKNNKD